MQPEINPYAAPLPVVEDESLVFRPHLAPRDIWDPLIGIPLGMLVVSLLAGCCAPLLYFGPPIWSHLFVLGLIIAAACVYTMPGIRQVRLSEAGLELKRYTGGSQVLGWEQFKSARTARRGEVAWASVFAPNRVCTYGFSYRDQCRLDWQGGYCYFPPRDPQAFLAAIKRQKADFDYGGAK